MVHTHGHGDHVAGDMQFADRPRTEVVGTARDDVARRFGLHDWPDGQGSVPLGERELTVIPSPGHDDGAVSYYDPATRWLLTGDTLYPGRLYVRDWPAFVATVDRLVRFADEHPVTHLLGCHIEMTDEPGRDYAIRTTYQPDEPPLEMDASTLRTLQDAVRTIDGRAGIHVFDHFIVYNGIPDRHFG